MARHHAKPDEASNDDSAARSLLRLRPDLTWSESPGAMGQKWRVKDPLALEYHEFGVEEQFLLKQFDGRTTLDAIRKRYNDRFAPRAMRPEQLFQFAADAHARGLLLAEGRRQGGVLSQRATRAGRQAWLGRLFSLLFLKLPGIDPNRLLDVLAPFTRWFWRPLTFLVFCVSGLVALAMLAGKASEFATRLPSSQEFLGAGNMALLIAAFVVTKAVHELAHGLACRHVGARCHEMGVLLIAFVPCLYCDVTDLWMVASRWKRMLVSAAGMYAELAIAVIACFLWMVATEGVVSAVLLNVMIACTVSTLLFNANPLLKLDGYFLLSDLVGVSNLQQKSQQQLWGPVGRWFRRVSPRESNRFDWRLAAYAALALAYRVLVMVLIAWAAYRLLAANGLRPVGDVLVALAVVGLLVRPIYRGYAMLCTPLLRRSMRWGRMTVAAALLVAVGAAMLAWPITRTITAPIVLEIEDAQPVAALAPGALVRTVAEGTQVREGQTIALLENPELRRRRTRLAGLLDRHRLQLTTLRRRATVEPALLSEIPTAEAAAKRARDDLAQLDQEIGRLAIRAPRSGMVVGVTRHRADASPGDPLPPWQGQLIDPANIGCWVEPGELLCLVAPDPQRMRATAMIDQSDTLGVRPGLPVRVLPYQNLGTNQGGAREAVVRTQLAQISGAEMQQLPEPLRRHPDLLLSRRQAQQQAAASGPAVLRPVLLATINFGPDEVSASHWSHGRCKIEAAREPLGTLLWRWVAQTFKLPNA